MSEKLSLVFWLVRKTVIFVFTVALLSSEWPVLAFLVIRVIPEASTVCGYRIMAITSAFQADDVGSIPATRSPVKLMSYSFIISTGEFSWRTDLAGGFVVLHSVDLTAYSFSAFFVVIPACCRDEVIPECVVVCFRAYDLPVCTAGWRRILITSIQVNSVSSLHCVSPPYVRAFFYLCIWLAAAGLFHIRATPGAHHIR